MEAALDVVDEDARQMLAFRDGDVRAFDVLFRRWSGPLLRYLERMLRDTRLAMIWTGTNEVMNLIIQHEYYRDLLSRGDEGRDVEADALEAEELEEKVYE